MIFYYAEGGALVCDEPMPGITSDLWDENERGRWSSENYKSWYDGHRYFVCESMTKETARRIAHALGGVLWDGARLDRQLVGATVDISREVTRHALYGEHPRKVAA